MTSSYVTQILGTVAFCFFGVTHICAQLVIMR